MLVRNTNDCPVASLPGIRHRTLAGAGDGLSRLSVWQQSIEPGGATPPHRHDCEEVVVIDEGSGELEVDGIVRRFEAPCTLAVEANALHRIVNTGAGPMRLIAVFSTTPVDVRLPDGQSIELPWST